MPPNKLPTSGLDHAIEQAGALLGVEAESIAASQHSSPHKEQNQASKIQKALAVIRSMQGAQPFFLGGALGPALIYALSKFPDEFHWGPVEDPGISMGAFVVLGSFAGSLVVGVATKLASIVAPTPQHYWSLLEVWSKYRMRRIPPEQYYEHGAALDYQWIYRDIDPHERPETQADFVRRVVRWRTAQKMVRKRGVRKGRAKTPVP
ncbi:hypothetical protein KYC5002_09995 [Archangium violaceum]|uniref:hypothetical protein n=1 Tax=Archangium violaceum TaxID=83451 RepID=UPI002B29502D|nr:hypothetical protein KYC5002_09995 [Archangium gephyra]